MAAFLTSIVLARNLGPDLYGEYATLMAEIGLIMIPISSGLSILVIREVSKSLSINPNTTGEVLFWPNLHVKLATIILVLIILVLIFFLEFNIFKDYLYACLAIVYFKSRIIYKAAIINGFDRTTLAQFLSILLAPLLLIIFLIIIFLTQNNISLGDAISCLFVSSLISWLACETISTFKFKIEKTHKKISCRDAVIFYKSLGPFLIMAMFASFNNEAAVILISKVHGPIEVAYFVIGLQAALVLLIIQNSINSVLMPKISSNTDDIKYCNKIIKSSVRFGSLVSAVILITYIFFAELAITYIYGVNFLGAYQIVVILGVAHFLNVIIGPTGLYMCMKGQEKLLMKYQISTSIIGFVISIFLVIDYGALGVALGVSFGLILYNVIVAKSEKKQYKIKTWLG
jgi:O-antigen/teichoic acid export membrane protein